MWATHQSSICDYIIFHQARGAVEDSAALYVLLCELKSGRPQQANEQLRNGKLLAQYILEMARRHCAIRLPDRIIYRGLVFSPLARVPRSEPKRLSYAFIPDAREADLALSFQRDSTEHALEHLCV